MSELPPNWEAFLEHLRVLLDNVNMPPGGLATRLHISPSAVTQWFSGRTRPLDRVGDILDVLSQKGAFQTPLALLDWTQLVGWEPDEPWLRTRFQKWFEEHTALPRGPILDDQGHLLSHSKHLVGRDNELNQAKEWLMSVERYRQPATKVVVIGGMPGVGKTALAQAIGRDPVIERYFRDGLLWAELGPAPDIDRWLREWAGLPGMPKDATSRPEAWLWKYLASEKRRTLIILDDVWPGTHFERLMIGGPQCRVLITSQVITIADLYEKVHGSPITTLEHSQALALALGLMERQVTEEEREGLKELVEIVGDLPLAVEVSVATMKSQGVIPVLN